MNEYRLEQLFDLQMGKTPSRNESAYWLNGLHDWISIRDLSNSSKYISETNEKLSDIAIKESGIRIIPRDTVIMSFKLSIGKVAITSHDMYSNEAIMAFHDKKIIEITPEYLYYLLLAKKWDEGSNKAVMGITLNKATLSTVKIKMHDFADQINITSVLDNLDKQINNKKKQLSEYDQLIKSRFVEMFGNLENKKRLEEFTILITKGASPKWQGIDYQDYGTLFVTSENVRDGYIDLTKPKYLDNMINKILPRSVLKNGDVLINIVGASIGRAAVYSYDYLANINQAVSLVRTKNINTKYLLTFLNSDIANSMYNDMKKGGARDNLSLKNISDLMIPDAPMNLQEEFASFVDQIDKLKFSVQKSLHETKKLFDSLMQKYFG